MQKENKRTTVFLTKDNFNNLKSELYKRGVSVQIAEDNWRGEIMTLVFNEKNQKLSLQWKVEESPDRPIERVDLRKMYQIIFSTFKKEKKEFDEGICKYCHSKIFWITDPKTANRRCVEREPEVTFLRDDEGNPIRVISYRDHNKSCTPRKEALHKNRLANMS